MPLTLLSQCFPKDSIYYFLIRSRLDDYIKIHKKDLLQLSFRDHDNPLVQEKLRSFINYDLHELVANELFTDLCIRYKQDDNHFGGRKEILNTIKLVYIKYSQFIRLEIADFFAKLSKLQNKLKKEKWTIKKVKKVSDLIEPIKISLDTRFAIIKRANGSCEGCGNSILINPIIVYQVRDNNKIKLKAYCEICRKKDEDIIENEF
jgi:hypothetical protein